VNKGTAAKGKRTAMIHLCDYPSKTEVDPGRVSQPQAPRLFYPLHNLRPWHPAMARHNGGLESPAVRLNRHRYHDNWLHNLLVSASLARYRR
jgi:hypothetical protein